MIDSSNEDKLELLYKLQELKKAKDYKERYESWSRFQPYDYQKKFFESGNNFRQRLLCAGNRCGKTFSMAQEIAYHATGIYPTVETHGWEWTGHRFSKDEMFADDGKATPHDLLIWCVGITSDSTRKVMQKELFGTESAKVDAEIGTGAIPREFVELDFIERDGNRILVAKIKHHDKNGVFDGYSTLEFRSTQQGEHVLMGATVDLIWLDEEDPHRSMEIYAQCVTRTSTTKGLIVMTATPENGMTQLLNMFVRNEEGLLCMQKAGWNDVTHLSEDTRKNILAGIPKFQHGMRIYGDIILGEGMVYACNEGLDSLLVDSFEIPRYWRRVCGIDIGITHYTAATWTAYDAETDTIYVYDSYRHKGETPAYHTTMIKSRGDWIPCVLPHDSQNTERGSGSSVAKYYRDAGLNALHDTFYNSFDLTDGKQNNFVNIGVTDILERMNTGRFKIFNTPNNKVLLEEMRSYQYKDGKIRKIDDDLVDSCRYSALSVKYRGISLNDHEEESLGWGSYESNNDYYSSW